MIISVLESSLCYSVILWSEAFSVLLSYTISKAIDLFYELVETPPSAHTWTVDLKMSCLIHVCIIKDCPSNDVKLWSASSYWWSKRQYCCFALVRLIIFSFWPMFLEIPYYLQSFLLKCMEVKNRKKQGRKKIKVFHLKSRKNYAAVPIYQHWSLCRNSPYISRKGMRIKHDPWFFFFLLESFLDRLSCRLCYEYLFNHNAQPFGKTKVKKSKAKNSCCRMRWQGAGEMAKAHRPMVNER